MGDGAVEVAALRGPLASLSVKFMPPVLQNASLRKYLSPAGSASFRPSHLATSAYETLCKSLIHYASFTKSWISSLLVLSIGAIFCFSTMYCYLTLGRRRRYSSQYGMVERLKGSSLVKGGNYDQGTDSDEFEYEDDSDESASQHSGLVRPIRRIFNFRRADRRSANRDSTSLTRGSSIVRITSSDPRSSLSSAPIQLDMDTKTQVPTTDMNSDASMMSVMQHSASVARRRRESGRLLNGVSSSSSPSRTTSPLGRSSPLRKSNSANHSSSPSRGPKTARSQLHKDAMTDDSTEQATNDHMKDSIISPSNSSQTFMSATSEMTEDFAVQAPTSILVRRPLVYEGKRKAEPSVSLHGQYSQNQGTSAPSSWLNSPTESNMGNGFAFGLQSIPPTSVGTRRLPPGAGHSPSSPLHSPLHRLGSYSSQVHPYWPEKRFKSIRLKEPDWTPYVEVHIRARERLETAAHVAANPRSASSPNLASSSNQSYGDSSLLNDKEEGREDGDSAQEDEFWFERFTQSTAAAGRDWDWRKRRRQRQLAAAAEADEDILRHLNESSTSLPETAGAGNVGMTDVYLQQQRREHARKTNQSLRGDEETSRPILTVEIDGESAPIRAAKRGNSLSPSSRQSSASPLGKALRMKRYSSNSESLIESPIEGEAANNDAWKKVNSKKAKGKNTVKKSLRRPSESEDIEEEDVSVPNRLSSLTPKIMKRSLGARRERDADLTAQLLAEAEEVATDDEEIEQSMSRRDIETVPQTTSSTFGMRKSASSSLLSNNYNHSESNTNGDMRSDSSVWGSGASGAWSSADAYGSSPQTARSIVYSQNSSSSPSPTTTATTTPRYSALHLLGGSELRREGSKADSQSSNTSDPPVISNRARSASRRGILSSASKAASGETLWRQNEGESPTRGSDSQPDLTLLPPLSAMSSITSQ